MAGEKIDFFGRIFTYVIPSKNSPKIFRRFTLNLLKIYSACQTPTQSLLKIYPKFGVYLLKLTQDLH